MAENTQWHHPTMSNISYYDIHNKLEYPQRRYNTIVQLSGSNFDCANRSLANQWESFETNFAIILESGVMTSQRTV